MRIGSNALNILKSLFVALIVLYALGASAADTTPLRVGVVGLTHTHVHWLLGREKLGDIEIVGIVEKNKDLARRYTQQHGLSMDIVFDSMAEMFDKTKPTAVTAFGSIFEHLAVVQMAAPRGFHVMVEKPLAVSLAHANKIKALADKYHITLMVNYETTWYPTLYKAYDTLQSGAIGELRKVVVHDGHKGPKLIGVNQEFLDWLGDPVQNGGGALTDFGCYGANLMTFLMQGKRPTSVTAVLQNFQKKDYPKVDDEATVILTYPRAQAIVQASWNWPIARKDLEMYGVQGQLLADGRNKLRTRLSEASDETTAVLPELAYPNNDPFAYFKGMIEGRIKPAKYDPSTLDNNMIVMEILDAATRSAKQGKTIYLKP